MAKDVCVFCGEAVGSFRSDLVYCGDSSLEQ